MGRTRKRVNGKPRRVSGWRTKLSHVSNVLKTCSLQSHCNSSVLKQSGNEAALHCSFPWDNYSFYSFRNPMLPAAGLLSWADAWSVKLAPSAVSGRHHIQSLKISKIIITIMLVSLWLSCIEPPVPLCGAVPSLSLLGVLIRGRGHCRDSSALAAQLDCD